MEICKNCNTQYGSDEEKCPKCDGATEVGDNKGNWVFLTKVGNDIEFGMVKGLLEMAGIPVVRKVRGVDGFLQIVLGSPLAGIDVMVPEDKYDEALELINAPVEEQEEQEEI